MHSGESSTPTLHIGRDWPGRPPTRLPRFELHGLLRFYTAASPANVCEHFACGSAARPAGGTAESVVEAPGLHFGLYTPSVATVQILETNDGLLLNGRRTPVAVCRSVYLRTR